MARSKVGVAFVSNSNFLFIIIAINTLGVKYLSIAILFLICGTQ